MIKYRNLQTPTFLVDDEITRKNASDIYTKVANQGVLLRPHVKTHKTFEIAQYQTLSEGKPITVSTLAELFFYQKMGFENQLLAIPITSEKVEYISHHMNIEQVLFVTDSIDVVRDVKSWSQAHNKTISFLIKIDSGAGRAGLQPKSNVVLELAKEIQSAEKLKFRGLMTHAGQSYHFTDELEKKRVAEVEVASIRDTAQWLESQGIDVEIRSIGSTPTVIQQVDLTGITEIRAGNYIWFDLFQYNRGNCSLNQIGCTVLASIIGIYPERETILIDAGALAMSKDPGFWPDGKTKYGLVKDYSELNFISVSQEHGIIQASAELCSKFKVGDKLRIYPNHSCLTAACFEAYHVIKNEEVIDTIKPSKFWI